jgi:hypothetical protein
MRQVKVHSQLVFKVERPAVRATSNSRGSEHKHGSGSKGELHDDKKLKGDEGVEGSRSWNEVDTTLRK